MKRFQIRVADCVIECIHNYDALPDCCKNYVTGTTTPDAVINITEDDIVYEKQRYELTARIEGREVCHYEDAIYEIAAANRLVSQKLLDFGTLLMHGSAVAVDRQTFIFTAKSGTGKSTHVSFWKEMFGEKATIVNDDKPFLKFTQDEILVYGSPWCGKEGENTNCCVPLRAICILKQASKNRIKRISFEEALPTLMAQIYRPQEQILLLKVMELIEQLKGKADFYVLECRPEIEAAHIAYEAMKCKQVGMLK